MILPAYFNITKISKAYSTLRNHQTFYKTSIISIVRILEMRRADRFSFAASRSCTSSARQRNKQITKKREKKLHRIVSNVAMDALCRSLKRKKKRKKEKTSRFGSNSSVRDSRCSRLYRVGRKIRSYHR